MALLDFWPQGAKFFPNWNNKLVILGIIRGHIRMKLDKIGPWPYLELPYAPFEFLARMGLSLIGNLNTKLALLGNKRGQSGITLVRMGPWPYLELLMVHFEFGHHL